MPSPTGDPCLAYYGVGCAVIQQVLWVLMLVSLLLMLRAVWSGSWATMWAAALISLAFCLIAIWSIGSLLFFIPCLQLGTAIGLRRAANVQGWLTLLAGAVLVFLLVVYGLALLRAQNAWVIAFPLAFIFGSLPLIEKGSARPGRGSIR